LFLTPGKDFGWICPDALAELDDFNQAGCTNLYFLVSNITLFLNTPLLFPSPSRLSFFPLRTPVFVQASVQVGGRCFTALVSKLLKSPRLPPSYGYCGLLECQERPRQLVSSYSCPQRPSRAPRVPCVGNPSSLFSKFRAVMTLVRSNPSLRERFFRQPLHNSPRKPKSIPLLPSLNMCCDLPFSCSRTPRHADTYTFFFLIPNGNRVPSWHPISPHSPAIHKESRVGQANRCEPPPALSLIVNGEILQGLSFPIKGFAPSL